MTVGHFSTGISRNYERLLAVVADNSGWVAFSGGVDSTLLLKAALEVNPSQAVALFADSELQSKIDRDNVRLLANCLGVELRVVNFAPLLRSDIVANGRDRCYLCKKAIYQDFQALLPVGTVLLDGTNRDDLAADRPGRRAITELGVVSPLVLAGLGKVEIREAARLLGLPNWKRPSSSCLATRIPEGFAIRPELLRHVEECERLIVAQGFGHVRMRLNKGQPEDVTVELAFEEMDRPGFAPCREYIGLVLCRHGIVGLDFVGRKGVFCG